MPKSLEGGRSFDFLKRDLRRTGLPGRQPGTPGGFDSSLHGGYAGAGGSPYGCRACMAACTAAGASTSTTAACMMHWLGRDPTGRGMHGRQVADARQRARAAVCDSMHAQRPGYAGGSLQQFGPMHWQLAQEGGCTTEGACPAALHGSQRALLSSLLCGEADLAWEA